MNEPLISIVILSLNKIDYTRICVSSLLESDYPNFEIIVVDNGSTDGSLEWLESFKTHAAELDVKVKLVANLANVGCSTARNQGITESEGEFIVFCDNDISLRTRSWLTEMRNLLHQSPERAVVGPKILYPFAPFDIQCAGVAVSSTGRVQFRGRGEARLEPEFNQTLEVQALISACFMVKKSVLDEVSGFDEIFNPVEYEDIDLCYRIRAAGYSVWYDHEVEMYHFENVTTEGTPSLSNNYLIIKHGMIFKERWQHMFSEENGPDDNECKWNKKIRTRKFSEIEELQVI